MGFWIFSRKPPHPLAADGMRALEQRILAGERHGAADELRQKRAAQGDLPGLRYLEALLYHEGAAATAEDLLAHLGPVLAPPGGERFPEAQLLSARLLGALGRLGEAEAALAGIRVRKPSPPLFAGLNATRARLQELRSTAPGDTIRKEALELGSELARRDLVVRYRLSDLARLDSLLDEEPDLAESAHSAWIALLGEIACQALSGRWRLALREQDHIVMLPSGNGWTPARALRERLAEGRSLYTALHRARGAHFEPLAGVPGAEVFVEPDVHLTVTADHVARTLLPTRVGGLAVLRARPSPEGPILLPVSFTDKSGIQRVLYIENRVWEPERVAELRAWTTRLRSSSLRHAELTVLSAYEPPPAVADLSHSRNLNALPGSSDFPGARAATPRSVDEPRLSWLDEKAEVMEHILRSALGTPAPDDLDLIRQLQHTVLTSLAGDDDARSPKQWNALWGYGALYGRLLARNLAARWTELGIEGPPEGWEMQLPWGATCQPLAAVLDLARQGRQGPGLVEQYAALKRDAQAAGGH